MRCICALFFTLALLGQAACGDGGPAAPQASPTAPPPTVPPATATATATPPVASTLEPLGFPIDPSFHLELVGPARTIQWGAGPEALTYSRDDQPSGDAQRANRSGWNCRVHLEYEGQPAVDWYVPIGTPIYAMMDGTATLYVITVANAFDYYGVDRRPYVGDPDRARASLSPFPGPGGGKGVFVRVENDGYASEYAHLDLAHTIALLPPEGFIDGYAASSDYDALFSSMRDFREATAIARWQAESGELIARSGDAGYSEAPHLHYTVRRTGADALLCPTAEAAFLDGGWLFR